MTLPPQATSGDLQSGSSTGSTSSAPLGETARELANQAKQQGAVKADALRNTTSQKVNAIADSARAAADALKQENIGPVSQYLEQFAGGLQRLSGTIRERSGEELLQEVNRLARQNPTMFMGACVALGFGLGRFVKATHPEARASRMSEGSDLSQSDMGSGGSSLGEGSSSIGSASSVGSSSGAGLQSSSSSSSLGGGAAAGSTPGVSEFSGSAAGPGASSVGEGAGTAGSRLAGGSGIGGSSGGPESWRSGSDAMSGTGGGSNISNDEAGGLSS